MARRKPPVEVRDSAIHGRGVYATRRIRRGAWIVEYTGEIISNEEADRRYDDDSMDQHRTYLFIRDEHRCIDATQQGGDARFINHSCRPNCEAVQDEDTGEIWIVALREIRSGEELSYDYNYEVGDTDPATARSRYPCVCGAPGCRGTIVRVSGG